MNKTGPLPPFFIIKFSGSAGQLPRLRVIVIHKSISFREGLKHGLGLPFIHQPADPVISQALPVNDQQRHGVIGLIRNVKFDVAAVAQQDPAAGQYAVVLFVCCGIPVNVKDFLGGPFLPSQCIMQQRAVIAKDRHNKHLNQVSLIRALRWFPKVFHEALEEFAHVL